MNVLPCPFCGVMPEIKKHWFIGTYEARCPNCEAWPTKYVDCNTTDEAVKCLERSEASCRATRFGRQGLNPAKPCACSDGPRKSGRSRLARQVSFT